MRVVECDRVIPTRSAVVRLLSDGELERGHQLRDGQVPAPVVLPDGTIVVLDGEKLLAVGTDLRGQELATVHGGEDWRWPTLDWEADGTLTVTMTSVSGPARLRIRYTVTARSAGPWSRREG